MIGEGRQCDVYVNYMLRVNECCQSCIDSGCELMSTVLT